MIIAEPRSRLQTCSHRRKVDGEQLVAAAGRVADYDTEMQIDICVLFAEIVRELLNDAATTHDPVRSLVLLWSCAAFAFRSA